MSKRVKKLGSQILQQKAEYLSNCDYVGLIIDEGNNYSRHCPLYAATISCDAEFNWRIQYIGQADTEGKKDGESIFNIVKNIFYDTGLGEVWEKKVCCVDTDGVSVMRSIAKYTGLDCNMMRGTSFSAFLKRELGESIDFWHCLGHQKNLTIHDAVDLILSLKLYYLPHLRMVHSEFNRSSKNRGIFKSLYAEMREFDKSFGWTIFYPVIHCDTRFIGLYKCVKIVSSKSNRALLYGRYVQ